MQTGKSYVSQGTPRDRNSHRRVKIVRLDFKRLGLFGRVVAIVLSMLVFSAVFFASVVVIATLVVFAVLTVITALIVSRNSGTEKGRVIEGELDVADGEVDIKNQKES